MKAIATVLFFGFFLTMSAQQYRIIGKVVDGQSGAPIDYATVIVKQKQSGEVISGATTENGGKFDILLDDKEVSLEFRFIGFQSKSLDAI